MIQREFGEMIAVVGLWLALLWWGQKVSEKKVVGDRIGNNVANTITIFTSL
jgi:hypothetical protein